MARLDPYIELLAAFLEQGSIDSATFETRFFELFKADETMFPDEEFLVLDKLFGDLDTFEPNPDLRDEGDLDEQELRASATEALTRLLDLAAAS